MSLTYLAGNEEKLVAGTMIWVRIIPGAIPPFSPTHA